MSIGVFFGGKQPPRITLKSMPKRWQDSNECLELLSAFNKPRDANKVLTWQSWDEMFDQSARQKVIKLMISDGALIECDLLQHVLIACDVPTLKELLSARNMPVVGKKEQLAQRLIDADPKAAKNVCKEVNALYCTPSGQAFANRWLAAKPGIVKAERLAQSAQYFKDAIQRYKGAGVREVTIHSVNDQHVCVACKELATKIYSIDEVPSLPYKGCTCEMGCRCFVGPKI